MQGRGLGHSLNPRDPSARTAHYEVLGALDTAHPTGVRASTAFLFLQGSPSKPFSRLHPMGLQVLNAYRAAAPPLPNGIPPTLDRAFPASASPPAPPPPAPALLLTWAHCLEGARMRRRREDESDEGGMQACSRWYRGSRLPFLSR